MTTSVRPLWPKWYIKGFKNPRGGLPEDMRSPLRREMIAAKVGVAVLRWALVVLIRDGGSMPELTLSHLLSAVCRGREQ